MKWYQQKTTWTGIAAIVAAVAGFATGELGIQGALAAVIGGLSIIFMRQGIAKVGTGVLIACVILAPACATDGSGRIQPATATNTTASTAQTARDQETAGGTYMGIGGDTTYNIHPAPGVTIPQTISDAVAKVLESDAPDDMKLLMLDKLGGLYGFRVTIDVKTSPQGNVDLAGSTGRSGIPPVTEPDEELPEEPPAEEPEPDGG